jgi:hypothetical protein
MRTCRYELLAALCLSCVLALNGTYTVRTYRYNPSFKILSHVLIYCVVPGDTLTSIAEELDVPLLGLEQVNQQIQDFDLIFPGEVIQVPVGLQGHLSCGDVFFLPTEVSMANRNRSVHLSSFSKGVDEFSTLATILLFAQF